MVLLVIEELEDVLRSHELSENDAKILHCRLIIRES